MSTKQIPRIQRVEINHDITSVYCPFCGKNVSPQIDASSAIPIDPCPHTLFIAHDVDFEYRSEYYDQIMGITGVASDSIDLGENGIDQFTDQLALRDAVKFACYQQAPSFLGTYWGFVSRPSSEESDS